MKKLSTIVILVALCTVHAVVAREKPARIGKTHDGKKRNVEEVFKKLDTDSDGAITLDEFKAGRTGAKKANRIETLFKKRDKDANGSLTLAEFKRPRPKKQKA